jgi:predicted metal-dependent phosphoesterase TrpH
MRYSSRVVRLDLHCHSTCSDGSLTPSQLCARVAEYGVELFCLTDHDTMSGYASTRDGLPGVRVLRGLELSCKWEGRNVHLLLYGVAEGSGGARLESRLGSRLVERRERIGKIVEKLESLGIVLDRAALASAIEGRTPGRPDVARALVNEGHCSSMREAFERYLHDGGPADVPVEGISVAEGCALAREAGARVSLAHPHTLRHYDLVRELLKTHREQGLDGLEVHYGSYAANQRASWSRLVTELELVATGGSDFHGDANPQISRPGIELPEPVAERLWAWLEPVAGACEPAPAS